MFKPVKKTRIYEEIVSKIKNMIDEGRLQSGDQLPTERELSEAFKVSRSSLREALRALESQGLLESRQGNGTFIAHQPIENLVNPLASVILTQKDGQMELFEMRRLVEPKIAFLAAERATHEEIIKMEEILGLQEEQVARGENGTDFDKIFHDALVKATKNSIIEKIMNTIMDSLAESRDKYLQVEGRPEKSLLRHRKIFYAIKAGDQKRAAKIMREHLEDIENDLLKVQHREEPGDSALRN
jgi:GntR family transcriptional repressor for pyruvate dehydrogenase complex